MIGTSARALLLSVGLLAASPSVAATTFYFTFDNTADAGPAMPPFVGQGTLTFATDPGTGVIGLNTVGAYSMSFTFGSHTLTEANITTTPSTVLLLISGSPGSERLQFSNTAPFGDGGSAGSIDLYDGPNILSFEPPGFGGTLSLYFFDFAGGSFFGSYTASQTPPGVPEPASWALMLGGFGVVGTAMRRRHKTSVRFI